MKRVGVDIGGTQLRCAIFDQDGNILEKFKIRNDRSLSAKENLDRLIAFIKMCIRDRCMPAPCTIRSRWMNSPKPCSRL